MQGLVLSLKGLPMPATDVGWHAGISEYTDVSQSGVTPEGVMFKALPKAMSGWVEKDRTPNPKL